MRALAALSILSVALLGCEEMVDADLLPLHRVGPAAIEPGVKMEIVGSGFPAGRPALVRLRGVFHRPGLGPAEVSVAAQARAVASDRIELIIGERLVSALGGRGTFRGALTVTFAGADEHARVHGQLDGVVLDVTSPIARRIDEDASHERDASAVLARAGISLAADAPAEAGLAVESVRPGSAAERAGLRAGDRLLELDGLLLAAPADFLPPPDAARVSVRAARGGEAAPVAATLELLPGVAPVTLDRLAVVAVPVALLLAVLAFLAPTARLFASAEREVRRMLGAGRGTGLSWREAFVALGALVVVVAPLAPRFVRERLDGISVVLLAVVTDVAVRAALDPAPASRWRRTLGAALRVVGEAIPPLCAVLAAALASGSVRIEGLVEAQSGAPWAWNALRSPMLAALTILFVRTGAGRPAPSPSPLTSGGEATLRVIERMRLLALAALGTAAFLGGWQIPGVPVAALQRDPALAIAAGAVFAGKAWLLALAIARARAQARRGLALGLAPALGSIGLATAAGLTALDPSRTTQSVLAAATFLGAGTITVVACARAALGRPLDPTPVVHPFH